MAVDKDEDDDQEGPEAKKQKMNGTFKWFHEFYIVDGSIGVLVLMEGFFYDGPQRMLWTFKRILQAA